jgi:hypothetical protein
MIKLLDLIETKNKINECTIVGSKIDNKILLIKNRDRNYHPKIKLIHELINGVEVAYMLDTDTDYSEGMNEYGIGIINATLQAEADENAKQKDITKKKNNIQSKDGFKIRTALGYKDANDVIQSIVTFTGFSTGNKTLSGQPTALNGHTFVGTPNNIFFIENISNRPPIVKKMENNQYLVRTNHGHTYTKAGYQKGKDYKSSIIRQKLTRKLLKGINSYKEIQPLLNKEHDVPGWVNPKRYDYKLWTSSQIELNLTDLELKLVINKETTFLGVERRLPEDYRDKIKINVQFDYEQ